jgi:hypothetical protein
MNKKIVLRIIVAIGIYVLLVLLVSAFYDDSPTKMKWEDRQEFNQQYITGIKLNKLTLDQILAELGNPDITEAKTVNNVYYQLTYYRTHHVKSDGITTVDECTPLLFKNELLHAIGKAATEQYQQAK